MVSAGLCAFLVIEHHVTECNRAAHSCVCNSFWKTLRNKIHQASKHTHSCQHALFIGGFGVLMRFVGHLQIFLLYSVFNVAFTVT